MIKSCITSDEPTHLRWCEQLIKHKFPQCAPAELETSCLLEIGYFSRKLPLRCGCQFPGVPSSKQSRKRGRLCRVTAASFYVNTSVRVERNKLGVSIEHIYCSLLFNNLFRTGRWYDKYDTYGKICTETFLVNVRSLHVLPRVVNAELLQSKLNLDFIKITNDLFCVTSVLKSLHNKIGVSVSGFTLGNINEWLQSQRQAFETWSIRLILVAHWDGCKCLPVWIYINGS
jgi:hypothetical protein